MSPINFDHSFLICRYFYVYFLRRCISKKFFFRTLNKFFAKSFFLTSVSLSHDDHGLKHWKTNLLDQLSQLQLRLKLIFYSSEVATPLDFLLYRYLFHFSKMMQVGYNKNCYRLSNRVVCHTYNVFHALFYLAYSNRTISKTRNVVYNRKLLDYNYFLLDSRLHVFFDGVRKKRLRMKLRRLRVRSATTPLITLVSRRYNLLHFHLFVNSTRSNSWVTIVVNNKIVYNASCGKIGFRKTHRSTYFAANQLGFSVCSMLQSVFTKYYKNNVFMNKRGKRRNKFVPWRRRNKNFGINIWRSMQFTRIERYNRLVGRYSMVLRKFRLYPSSQMGNNSVFNLVLILYVVFSYIVLFSRLSRLVDLYNQLLRICNMSFFKQHIASTSTLSWQKRLVVESEFNHLHIGSSQPGKSLCALIRCFTGMYKSNRHMSLMEYSRAEHVMKIHRRSKAELFLPNNWFEYLRVKLHQLTSFCNIFVLRRSVQKLTFLLLKAHRFYMVSDCAAIKVFSFTNRLMHLILSKVTSSFGMLLPSGMSTRLATDVSRYRSPSAPQNWYLAPVRQVGYPSFVKHVFALRPKLRLNIHFSGHGIGRKAINKSLRRFLIIMRGFFNRKIKFAKRTKGIAKFNYAHVKGNFKVRKLSSNVRFSTLTHKYSPSSRSQSNHFKASSNGTRRILISNGSAAGSVLSQHKMKKCLYRYRVMRNSLE